MVRLLIIAFCFMAGSPLVAQSISPRDGWSIANSSKDFETLTKDLKAAVKDHGLRVVTQAGPTKAAAKRGIIVATSIKRVFCFMSS